AGGLLATWVVAKHLREQASAEARAARMGNFYRALSRTNRLIVRGPTEEALFEELCRICVETGHAAVARVDRLDDLAMTRVAVAGPAAGLFSGPGQWRLDDPLVSKTMIGMTL